MTLKPLDSAACHLLAETLGDTCETVISVHLLRRGLCEAYLLGDLDGEYGAIVRDRNVFGEPAAYGNSPALIWELLQSLTGWFCVNIASELGAPIAMFMERDWGVSVRYLAEIYYTLNIPVNRFNDPAVRQMTLDDLDLLEAAPAEVWARGFGGTRRLLEHGYVACALVDNQIVAVAYTYARTERHADIGVSTLPVYRGRGFVTAAASLVTCRVQEAGQIPVWSTGEDNDASQRVAQKLGFTEVRRSMYLNVDKKD